MCGPILPYVQNVGKEGPGPISSLRANEYSRTSIRGMAKLPSEERWSMLVRNWAVSEDEGHLETFVRGIL